MTSVTLALLLLGRILDCPRTTIFFCGAFGGKIIVSLKNFHNMSIKKPEASLQAIEITRFKVGGWECKGMGREVFLRPTGLCGLQARSFG